MSDPAPPKGPELHAAADARGFAQHVAGALLATPTGNDTPGPDAPEPPPDDAPPSPLYAVAPETVRITVMWTGDPAELDRALLALRENSRALRMLSNRVHASESTRRALQADRLGRQLLAGALGEDEDEDIDEECHEHLTVVRHDRGGAAR